jgi:hypothetical protein
MADIGVNFMEKTISVRKTAITFSIWDLGGLACPCAVMTHADLIPTFAF